MFTAIRQHPRSAGLTEADVTVIAPADRFVAVARFIYANAPEHYGLSDDESDWPSVLAVQKNVGPGYSFTLRFAEDPEVVLEKLADRQPIDAFEDDLGDALHEQFPSRFTPAAI